MGAHHGLQSVGGAAGRLGRQQSRAQRLQLCKVSVPPAGLSVLGVGQAHAVAGRLLPGVCPASVPVQDLAAGRRAFLELHTHLVQLRVCLPQLVVPLCALLHDLLGDVHHKGVGVSPVHPLALAQVVAQRTQPLRQPLGAHLAAVVGPHSLCNASQALFRDSLAPACLHGLLYRLHLGVHVPEAAAVCGVPAVCVHLQLVFHGCFFRVELLGLGLRHGLQVVQRSSRQRLGSHSLDISVGIV